jgi:hypothetical protein
MSLVLSAILDAAELPLLDLPTYKLTAMQPWCTRTRCQLHRATSLRRCPASSAT